VSQHAHLPRAARIVFGLTALVAVAVVVLGSVRVPGPGSWAWWLIVPAVPVLYRFPVEVTRGSRGIEIGFESVVVIFLAFAAPDYALVLWTASWLLAQVQLPHDLAVQRTSPWISVYNTAMTTLSGAAAVLVVTRLVPHALDPGPSALLAVVAGAGAYFVVDYVLSALAIPLLGRGSFREAWLYDDLTVALASFGGVAAVGYLGAVAFRADPWTVVFLAVPVATFVYASRGFTQASVERVRVTALLNVASRLHHATTYDEVVEIVLDEGRAALLTEALHVTTSEPDGTTISAPVTDRSTTSWLVPATRRSQAPYDAENQTTLDLLASMASDTLSRLALHGELEQLAAHDPLTGLANRASLQHALAAALADHGHETTAVLFCDLDAFKDVNDDHGHDAGDQLLVLVAERMRACVRDSDVVARMGGDEFVVLLPQTSREVAATVADRLSAAIQAPSVLDTGTTVIGVSIGVAVSAAGTSAEDLLRKSDAAMYDAKSSGKNRVCFA